MTGKRLDGKVALITGAESGMGAATARLYSSEGARLILLGLREELLEPLAAELGAVAVVGDAADPDVVAAALDAARERHRGLDNVTTCAGRATFGEYALERGISRNAAYAELGEHVPLRGPNEPEHVASACLFLASGDSAGITGTNIVVDNGQSALTQAAIPFLIRR
jgi:NAD(P)-dependent dehydrogenase (short-subunit alcohol dehydrogenase family)